MNFIINATEYKVFWSYKKRRKGRVKTICKIVPVTEEKLAAVEYFIGTAQNNISEGDRFLKKTGRKYSFLRALEVLINTINPFTEDKFAYREIKSSVFKQLKESKYWHTIV